MEWDDLSLGRILARRPKNAPENPINRKALQTLKGKKNLVGAEIGVSAGDNAFDMLVKLDIEKLYLIDPYEKFLQWSQEIQNVHWDTAHSLLKVFDDKTTWIREPSNKAFSLIADGELDFVYLDGAHNIGAVKEDIKLYWPKVKIGGLFCGDNLEFKPVFEAVTLFKNTRKEKFCFDYNLDVKSLDWWFIKERD